MLPSLETLARKHYENFPVGSWFIPKRYRKPIHLIYTFARVADDIADEGSMAPSERIARIDHWEQLLENGLNGKSEDKYFLELASVIREFNLSPELLKELLVAFRRDSTNPLFNSFEEVLGYCRYSANPIGRLMLEIFECSNDRTVRFSDDICTALQLTNFWQDISVDTARNRFYIPQSDMHDVGLDNENLLFDENKKAFCALIKKQVMETKALFVKGQPLADHVTTLFRFELALIWHGGMRILEKIEAQNYDTRKWRPSLNTVDHIKVFLRASLQ